MAGRLGFLVDGKVLASLGLFQSGAVGLAVLGFPRCAAQRCCRLFGFGPSVILMPNKPVKGTARHSGWRS